VQILEVGALARSAELLAASILQDCVDLDDIGAPVRKLPHAGRAGPHPRQVKHGEADRACEADGKAIWAAPD